MMALGVGLGLAVPGCVRLNPEFGAGDDATGAESAGGSTLSGPVTEGDDESDASTLDSDSMGRTDLAGPTSACGNDRLEAGEQCDDGNLEREDGCDNLCRIEPRAEPVYDPPFQDDVPGRFNAIAVAGGVVVAAGRGADSPADDHYVHLVAVDPATGLVGELKVPSPPGVGAEARGLAVNAGEIYFAGRTNEPGVEAILGRTSLEANGSFALVQDIAIAGTRAKGIAFRGDQLLVTTGEYDRGGLGLVSCPTLRSCSDWFQLEDGSQLDDVVVVGREVLAAGLRLGHPEIYAVEDVSSVSGLDTLYSDLREGRIQALASDQDVIYAAGSVLTGTSEQALLVAYSLSGGSVVWTQEIDARSENDDEFEDVAVTPDGDVVVVGMLGNPPAPVVFEFGADGVLHWILDVPLKDGAESGYARSVVVDGPEIYIAGEWRTTYEPSNGLNTTGVGFIARIVR